jgi:hypothetical protein
MAGFAPVGSLPVAALPQAQAPVGSAALSSNQLLKQLLYRRRFTSRWHKGWKPHYRTKRFVWQANLSPARVTWDGLEVSNRGDTTQSVRVTWNGLEVGNRGAAVQPIRVTWVGLEVTCSLQGLDDGIVTLIF